MSLHEIASKVDQLSNLHEQFKKVLEQRLQQVEQRGSADPLTTQQLARMNHQIDHQQAQLDQLKAWQNRPALGALTKEGGDEYHQAFCQYLRTGTSSNLEVWQQKTLVRPGDSESGYLLSSRMHESVYSISLQHSAMRKIANVATISGDALEFIEDKNTEIAGWTAEMDVVLNNSQHSALAAKKVIPVHELYAQPRATQKMLDDPRIDVENWLSTRLANAFNQEENITFIKGDGQARPRGILSYPSGKGDGKIEHLAAGNGQITAESLVKLVFSINSKYAQNAKFLLSRDALHHIRMLRTADGQYLWQKGLQEGNPATILGCELVVCDDMPSAQSKNVPIAFGDFQQAYQIVDRQSIRILRDPYTTKPFVKFYSTKRVGGDVVDFDAIKLLQL